MAMRIGKREQLSGGIILMLVSIALAHVLIFQPRQSALREAKNSFVAVTSEISQYKQVDSRTNLTDYETRTAQLDKEYTQIVSPLNIKRPALYTDATPANRQKQKAALWQAMRGLAKFRDENKDKVKLSFLESTGWDFPASLSTELTTNNASRLVDYLHEIEGTLEILDVIHNEESEEETRQELYIQLTKVGIDVQSLERIYLGPPELRAQESQENSRRAGPAGFNPMMMAVGGATAGNRAAGALAPVDTSLGLGVIVPTLKIMYQVDMFGRSAEAYKTITPSYAFKRAQLTDQLFKHVRVVKLEYPDPNGTLTAVRQLEALVDVLKSAAEYNIKDVSKVTLKEMKLIRDFDDPNGATLAATGPIAIQFTAENSSAWRFLWKLNHCDQLYEIENVTIKAQERGLVTVDVLMGVVFYVFGGVS